MRPSGLACLLLALACGDIETVSGGDSGPAGDGGRPDARAVGSVTVTVGKLFGPSQPLEGNQVVIVDPAGAIVADLTTDAGGAATADDIEAGSTLIVLIAESPAGAPNGSQALVILGVEPGDDLVIAAEAREGAAAGDMNVSWPPHPGATMYHLDTGCSTASTNDSTTAMTFYTGCLVDGDAQVLIRAADGTDATVGWIGGTAPFGPGAFDVAGPWSDPHLLTVSLSDRPAEALFATPRLRPARGATHFSGVTLPEVDLEAGPVEITFSLPASFADSDLVSLDFRSNQPGVGDNSLAIRVPADETEVAVSLAEEVSPFYGFPVLDSPARTFSWTRISGHELDAQFVAMFFTEKEGTERLTLVMAPPEVTSVTLPQLPSEFEPFMPTNPAQVAIQVQGAESTELDGYRAARQTGFTLIHNTPAIGLEPPSTLRRSAGGDDF